MDLIIIEVELTKLEEKSNAMTAEWEKSKSVLADTTKLKEELEKAHVAQQQALRLGDYTKAGELQYDLIPRLEEKLKAANVPYEAFRYDAPHAFGNEDWDYYDAEASKAAWQRSMAFFEKHLKG